jgi:hypothetical protein
MRVSRTNEQPIVDDERNNILFLPSPRQLNMERLEKENAYIIIQKREEK